MHYGKNESRGSEHLIDGVYFPGELQLCAFNSQLYSSWSDAETRPNGVAAVSVMMLMAGFEQQNKVSRGVRTLTQALKISSLKGETRDQDPRF